MALVLLDGVAISADEVQRTFYGTSTADAVLGYKRKRNIINPAYQTQADNIVGKMTMARLDREILKREIAPHAPVRIVPKSRYVLRHPLRSAALPCSSQWSSAGGVECREGYQDGACASDRIENAPV